MNNFLHDHVHKTNSGNDNFDGKNLVEQENTNAAEHNPQWWWDQEEIVISGISGHMPESSDMKEFAENLFNGIDMITEDDRRWEPGNLNKQSLIDLRARLNREKLSEGFYGLPKRHGKAFNMDPQLRLLLETNYEAIIDAGVNPKNLRGTNCGVFVANSISETSSLLTSDLETIVGYSLTGCTRSMFSNRISFDFDLRGPSFTVDAACSSSLLAFQLAVDSMRQGQCDSALVSGAQLTLSPNTALQFLRLTMLSPDGKCKAFDANGNGYVRSECVGTISLQKLPQARRNYAIVVHAKSKIRNLSFQLLRIDLDGIQPDKACIHLNEVTKGPPVFFLHSIEGIGSTLVTLAKEFKYLVYCFQCTPEAPDDRLENLALFYIHEMRKIQASGPYRIVGYSYGATIAFEMAAYLQNLNNADSTVQCLIMLDGSHKYMGLHTKIFRYKVKHKFHGDITLVRAKIGAAREEDIGEDYGLGEVLK